eukprot:3112409-Ditylum_brightwellii.AAC.2
MLVVGMVEPEGRQIPIATMTKVDAQVKLQSCTNPTFHTLQQKNPDDSICQLGLLNNLLEVLKDDYNKRYSTYAKMAYRISKHFITPKNAWRIYQNVWLPAGQYPLAVTNWTLKECEKLMSPFLHAILPKLGFNWHMP